LNVDISLIFMTTFTTHDGVAVGGDKLFHKIKKGFAVKVNKTRQGFEPIKEVYE